MRNIFILVAICFISACSTGDKKSSKFHHDQEDYEKVLSQYTQEKEQNEGLYNVFSVKATFLDSQVQLLQLNKKAYDYLWNDSQYDQERTKILESQKNETQVFISFFTPKKKHDDLTMGSSIWRIYLESEGKRYNGKIEKYIGTYEQIHSFFPAHTQWATPYIVTFPVSVTVAEKTSSNLIVTGPLGNQTLSFIK